jgi:hypothetical protein
MADVLVRGSEVVVVGGWYESGDESGLPTTPVVWTSTDFHVWKSVNPGSAGRAVMQEVVSTPQGWLIAAGYDWDRNVPTIWLSKDGATWTFHEVDDSSIDLVDNVEVRAIMEFGSGALLVGQRFGGINEDIAILVWEAPGD